MSHKNANMRKPKPTLHHSPSIRGTKELSCQSYARKGKEKWGRAAIIPADMHIMWAKCSRVHINAVTPLPPCVITTPASGGLNFPLSRITSIPRPIISPVHRLIIAQCVTSTNTPLVSSFIHCSLSYPIVYKYPRAARICAMKPSRLTYMDHIPTIPHDILSIKALTHKLTAS